MNFSFFIIIIIRLWAQMAPEYGQCGRLQHGLRSETLNIATYNIKYISWTRGCSEDFCMGFPHCKSMEANNRQDMANLDPRGMVGIIYELNI